MGITVAYQPSAQVIGDAAFAVGQGALRERQQAMAQQAALQRQAQRTQMQMQSAQIDAQQKRDAQQAWLSQSRDEAERRGKLEYLKAQHGYTGEERAQQSAEQRNIDAARAMQAADLAQQKAEEDMMMERSGQIREGLAGVGIKQELYNVDTEIANVRANSGGLPEAAQYRAMQMLTQKRRQLIQNAQIKEPPTFVDNFMKNNGLTKDNMQGYKVEAGGIITTPDGLRGVIEPDQKNGWKWKKDPLEMADTAAKAAEAKQKAVEREEKHLNDLYMKEVDQVATFNRENDKDFDTRWSAWTKQVNDEADKAYKAEHKAWENWQKGKQEREANEQLKPSKQKALPALGEQPPEPKTMDEYWKIAERENAGRQPQRRPDKPIPVREELFRKWRGESAPTAYQQPDKFAGAGEAPPGQVPEQAQPQNAQRAHQELATIVMAKDMSPDDKHALTMQWAKNHNVPQIGNPEDRAKLSPGALYLDAQGNLRQKK